MRRCAGLLATILFPQFVAGLSLVVALACSACPVILRVGGRGVWTIQEQFAPVDASPEQRVLVARDDLLATVEAVVRTWGPEVMQESQVWPSRLNGLPEYAQWRDCGSTTANAWKSNRACPWSGQCCSVCLASLRCFLVWSVPGSLWADRMDAAPAGVP